ncbi:SpaH/EbpB family LPXTG-anchored major pilin [Bifidobacterium sp. 82T24]|uniref:SpaH/EbpB family LPXTG-anchored major pilin n=1 Tax=Bifidobacterium saimiriisciurei TaxID=2661627 RepID=A0ABX0CBM9_9BIFI|nr:MULTISPECIES: SpaH/EbpB family LPXTG-anchored major pilin [Bifidobacterium]MBW3088339.1 SpaH/EbpB family LPXTG-anchored major pilin [Bifidobacterium pluvialisilvae]NEG97032.1 SpaH/EbpB family LPXTG-anchored major pilin [Bifidobacterium sp. SMB2]NEH11985.1 SpaH/EbpB family LPXTG-anchored major pilin [Bifidobacterium saimiriisciurei]
MKMRKLFAGIAAAATLLGGLALGGATANAVDADANTGVVTSNATFKFTVENAAQWSNRSLSYYKLADYVQYDANTADATASAYGVQTVNGHSAAIEAALKTAGITVPTGVDPMAYAMGLETGGLNQSAAKPWNEGTTRKFADALKNALAATDLTEATLTDDADNTKTVSLPAGVYLFLDTAASSTDNDAKVLTAQSAAMVVSSGTLDKTNKVITDPTTAAEVNLKNHITTVAKTADDKDNTVSTGQTVHYTVTTQLPITTGFADYTFKIVDTPGAGQDVNKDVKVTVDGTEVTEGTDYDLTYDDTTDAAKFTADGAKSFTIDFAKLLANAEYNTKPYYGKTVVVTYSAKVTADTDPVTNDVSVNNNGTEVKDHTNLTLGKFDFVKTDAQGNALDGARFKIEAADDDDTDDVVPVTPTNAEAEADANGKVEFKGLADGRYLVTETQAPKGFANFMAKFYVTISGGEATDFEGADAWGLAPSLSGKTDDDTYAVKNVRNITELPKTGAAGIALFAALGVLLAGAAAAVFAKSRKASRMLNA